MSTFVLSLSDSQATLENVGGKGMSLAKLARAGIPVPDGFHITTEGYRQFVAANNLQTKILSALTDVDVTLPATLETASASIGRFFAEAIIPTDIASVITNAYYELCDRKSSTLAPGASAGVENPKSVAVRSSATAEDLPEASFAGQQETYLNIRGDEAVLDAVKKCWASLWTARAISYRVRQNIAPDTVALAVVVQELVFADAAGIMFTTNPISGDRSEVVINATWGLGEALVSGAVTPDTVTVNKQKGRVVRRETAEKSVMTVRTESGTQEQPVPDPLKKKEVLTKARAIELTRYGTQVESLYEMPMDIEWTWTSPPSPLLKGEGGFAIVQARPITSNHDDEWNDSLSGDFLWTKTNVGEAIAETMTPLTWSIAQFTFSDMVYLPGVPTLGNICGIPYFNFTGLASALRTLGLSQKYTLSIMEDLLNIRLPEQVEIPLIPTPRRKFFSILYRFANLFSYFNQGAKDAPDYLRTNRKWFEHIREKISQEKTSVGLLKLWQDEIQGHIKRGFWVVLGTANASADATFSLRRKLVPFLGLESANMLIANLSDGSDMLASLGLVVGLSKVASGEMTRDAYLEQFGHRGPNEFELSVPRPVENLEWIEHELSRFKEQPLNVQALLSRQKESFNAAWARFAKRYPNKVKSVQRDLAQSARQARLREQVRSEYVRDRWLVRLFALRVGELTDLRSDVFFLTQDELLDLLSGKQAAIRLIPARKDMYQRLKSLPSFPLIIRGHFDPFKWAENPQRRSDIFDVNSSTAKDLSAVISGSPGSAGNVEGIVRIIDDPKNGDQLQQGEILVAVQTDIAWTLLFPRAAAVVTDVGAVLSHTAIVAREMGIPAVVGCGNATMLLKTGDRVRVDGSQGIVEIMVNS